MEKKIVSLITWLIIRAANQQKTSISSESNIWRLRINWYFAKDVIIMVKCLETFLESKNHYCGLRVKARGGVENDVSNTNRGIFMINSPHS